MDNTIYSATKKYHVFEDHQAIGTAIEPKISLVSSKRFNLFRGDRSVRSILSYPLFEEPRSAREDQILEEGSIGRIGLGHRPEWNMTFPQQEDPSLAMHFRNRAGFVNYTDLGIYYDVRPYVYRDDEGMLVLDWQISIPKESPLFDLTNMSDPGFLVPRMKEQSQETGWDLLSEELQVEAGFGSSARVTVGYHNWGFQDCPSVELEVFAVVVEKRQTRNQRYYEMWKHITPHLKNPIYRMTAPPMKARSKRNLRLEVPLKEAFALAGFSILFVVQIASGQKVADYDNSNNRVAGIWKLEN